MTICIRSGKPAPDGDCWCVTCSAVRMVAEVVAAPAPSPRQDTRRTSPEKLEKIREIANDMTRMAAREPDNDAFQKMTLFSEQIHRALDGEF